MRPHICNKTKIRVVQVFQDSCSRSSAVIYYANSFPLQPMKESRARPAIVLSLSATT